MRRKVQCNRPDIPEESDPASRFQGATDEPPKAKRKSRAVQIVQRIETMFVEPFNQTNYNVGDLSNAIQSVNNNLGHMNSAILVSG
jgi:hypothetical protein